MDSLPSLQELYGLSFPETFFQFQEFVDSLPDDLRHELLHSDGMGVSLEGSYRLHKGEIDAELPNPLWQSRYYDDPPEFITILSGNMDGLHWGYYIDDPNNPRFPVVSYYSRDAFTLSIQGDDVFEAIRAEIEDHYETCLDYMDDDPDEPEYAQSLERMDALRKELQKHSTGDRPETGQEYWDQYEAAAWREPVAKTRDEMGICIPPHLYQPLSGEDKFQIWNYEPTLEEVEQYADEAMRLLQNGYPGAALKLGKDLWVYHDFAPTTYTLLDAAYQALDRPWLRKMLQVAREYRAHCDASRPPKPQE
jgi:hypothetical protein